MRDDEERTVFVTQRVDAFGDDAQRIDIKARICFIQHAKCRLQKRHLQNFRALLFAAREADVNRALQHLDIDVELGAFFLDQLHEGGNVDFSFSAPLFDGVERRAQERETRDARDFHRILEGQEHALSGALVGRQLQDAFAIPQDIAVRHFVAGAASKHVGKRGFTRPVRAHDGVHFSSRNFEGQPLEDRLVLVRELHVQVFDFEHI